MWLALVAFAESSFFPVPPDLMLMPMCLARRDRALRYGAICALGSVAGSLLGYTIGYYLGDGLLRLFGLAEKLSGFQALYARYGIWVILIQGLLPIVPFKLVTIASGIAHFKLEWFLAAAALTRSTRFFVVAGLIKAFGAPVQAFVEKRLVLVTCAIGAVLLIAILAIKLL